MIAYNHVIIIGNLTRDPDVKTVGNGMRLAHMSVCINEKRKTQDGRILDCPVFIDVDAWARLAEICEKYLAKNSQVFVEGKIQMAQWEKDGVKHQKLKIRASNIKFLPKGNRFANNDKKEKGQKDDRSSEADTYIPDDTPEAGGDDSFAETMRGW